MLNGILKMSISTVICWMNYLSLQIFFPRNLSLINAQTFSMGFTSSVCDGQSSTLMSCLVSMRYKVWDHSLLVIVFFSKTLLGGLFSPFRPHSNRLRRRAKCQIIALKSTTKRVPLTAVWVYWRGTPGSSERRKYVLRREDQATTKAF